MDAYGQKVHVQLKKGDIKDQDTDSFVRFIYPNEDDFDGLLAAAGDNIRQDYHQQRAIPVGYPGRLYVDRGVVCTSAGNIAPNKRLFHVEVRLNDSIAKFRTALHTTLRSADQQYLKSIAFPALRSTCPVEFKSSYLEVVYEFEECENPRCLQLIRTVISATIEVQQEEYLRLSTVQLENSHFQRWELSVSAEPKFNLTTGSWVLEKVFVKSESGKLRDAFGIARGIAVSPTGQIAVANDTVSASTGLQVFSAEGQHQLSIDTTQGTTSFPLNVAVSPEGDYYDADCTRFIKSYDSSGMYKNKWVAVSPDNKPSDTEDAKLVGLTIDNKGQLLVGENLNRYISVHRQDGTHIGSMRINIRPTFLAVTSQATIIVSNRWDEVQIVDITGHMLHTIKPPPHVASWGPYGVCCYEDIICICNCASLHYGIYCYSSSGEYLKSIDTNEDPGCLAVGNERLYVTYWDRVEIYSCK